MDRVRYSREKWTEISIRVDIQEVNPVQDNINF